MDSETFSYMITPGLFPINFIPLWHPSPLAKDPQNWRWNVCPGDIGYFTSRGGFRTLFNVLQTREENVDHGYDPPDGFIPYAYDDTFKLKPHVQSERQSPHWDYEIVNSVGFLKETW